MAPAARGEKKTEVLHQRQLPGMVQLEAGDPLAVGQHGGLAELPQLPSVHKRFQDVLLNLQVSVGNGLHGAA